MLNPFHSFKPNQIKQGTTTWSKEGNITASISFTTNTQSKQPFIELNYNYKNKPISYKINIVSIDSNLSGLIWYFICPQTKKRCRKLYYVDGYFLHREANNKGMYECQTQSKHYRNISKICGARFKIDNIYKKHFKTFYDGKPTKRYKKFILQTNEANKIAYSELKSMFMYKKRNKQRI